jgi:hypothetical protein
VVATGAGITSLTPRVGDSVATEVEFDKLRAVGRPLENDRLGPVLPQERGDNEIFVMKTSEFGKPMGTSWFAAVGRPFALVPYTCRCRWRNSCR